jgi:hypothetical protein
VNIRDTVISANTNSRAALIDALRLYLVSGATK